MGRRKEANVFKLDFGLAHRFFNGFRNHGLLTANWCKRLQGGRGHVCPCGMRYEGRGIFAQGLVLLQKLPVGGLYCLELLLHLNEIVEEFVF